MWPETFGNFAPPLAKSGGWRPSTELEKPLLAGISPTNRDGFPEDRTAWLGREDSNCQMVNWICNVLTPIAHHGKSFSANQAKWLFVFNSNFLRMNEAHRS
jgi:hypothetical protein